MSGILLQSACLLQASRTVFASQSRCLAISCRRYQQQTKLKAKETTSENKRPENVEQPKITQEKRVFQDNSEALPTPAVEGQENYSPKILRLIDDIAGLTLLEVADLNKALKKRLNLPDTPMMPVGGMIVAGSAAAPKAAADDSDAPAVQAMKSKFVVKLVKIDEAKKISVIKEIKSIVAGLNLVQAKKLVESLPQTVKGDILKDEADKIAAQLTAQGATCEIE